MSTLAFTHRFEQGTSSATVLVLHGTGGNEDDLLPLARQLAPAANLLSPRGQVIEQGMPRFFHRLGPGVFDETDLLTRTADLAAFVRDAAEEYGFDAAKVCGLGYSNGANIAAALLLLHPATLAGAALLRATLPLEPPALPQLGGKPVLLASGTHDPYAAGDRVHLLADWLTRAGAQVDLRWEEAGHELTRAELAHARTWMLATLR